MHLSLFWDGREGESQRVGGRWLDLGGDRWRFVGTGAGMPEYDCHRGKRGKGRGGREEERGDRVGGERERGERGEGRSGYGTTSSA